MVAGGVPSGTVQWVPGDLFKSQWHNFGPSVGFAWDPFSTGKTSFRANYRIAYDRINTFVLASQMLPNLPGNALAVINQSFGQGGGRLANLPGAQSAVHGAQRSDPAHGLHGGLEHGGGSQHQDAAHARVVAQHPAPDCQRHGGRCRLYRAAGLSPAGGLQRQPGPDCSATGFWTPSTP